MSDHPIFRLWRTMTVALSRFGRPPKRPDRSVWLDVDHALDLALWRVVYEAVDRALGEVVYGTVDEEVHRGH